METGYLEFFVVLISLAVFSVISVKKKALDLKGAMLAVIVGLLVFYRGGFFDFFLMVIFFIVADISTKYARQFNSKKHEVRTIDNILGNSGAALIALFLGSQIGFVGAVSAALADTLSSEIGLLSKKKPVLITSLKKVEPGTDGGITFLGCMASVFGALIIAIANFLYGPSSGLPIAIIIVLAGFSGSIADSIVGALFERKGGLNNMQVNFLGSIAGAIIAFLAVKTIGF